MSLDQMRERVENLTRRHKAASDKKSKLQGSLEAKKEELKKLIEEVKEAGFNPKTLKEDKEKLEAELTALMDTFEANLTTVEEALAEYES